MSKCSYHGPVFHRRPVQRVLMLMTTILLMGSLYAPAPSAQVSPATVPVVVEALRAMTAAVSAGPIAAQVTCGWCEEFPTFGDTIIWMHQFFDDNPQGCNFVKPSPTYSGGVVQCSRCGGTSDCHTWADVGPCHIECGEAGGDNALFAEAYHELRKGPSEGDVKRVSAALRLQSGVHRVEYIAEGGRVELFGGCDSIRPAAIFAIPLEMRPLLEQSLRE